MQNKHSGVRGHLSLELVGTVRPRIWLLASPVGTAGSPSPFRLPDSTMKRSAAGALEHALKRPNIDLAGLPTHLPHHVPSDTSVVDKPVPLDPPKPKLAPVYIPGTTISLETEEDIQKWIEERRKNWPTRKNVEAKQTKASTSTTKAGPPPAATEHGQKVCQFFSRNQNCKFGAKCKNLHHSGGTDSSKKIINGIEVKIPQRYKQLANGSGSLFSKLVQKDLYEHENSTVLDFLEYLEKAGMLDPKVEP